MNFPIQGVSEAPLSGEDFICTTLPSYGHPYGQTECILRRSMEDSLLSIITHLPLSHPPDTTYCIRPSRHGLGMFATQNLSMGDLILTERPLTITPTYLRVPVLEKDLEGLAPPQRRQTIMNMWEERFFQPLFTRLEPEEQAAFMALANSCVEDDCGPILGIIKTNGLETTGVVDPVTGDQYASVCRDMSRINHRCVDICALRGYKLTHSLVHLDYPVVAHPLIDFSIFPHSPSNSEQLRASKQATRSSSPTATFSSPPQCVKQILRLGVLHVPAHHASPPHLITGVSGLGKAYTRLIPVSKLGFRICRYLMTMPSKSVYTGCQ